MSKYNLDSDAVEDIKINYHLFPRKHFSAKYNIPISQVYYIGTKTGVRITETARNNEQNIVNEYTNGSPIRHIANKFHLDRDSIRAILVKNKVELTSQSDWSKRYSWDESYFEKIDTHEKAYWLGFIYADGNVRITKENTKRFQISLKDRDAIFALQASLKSNHKLFEDVNCLRLSICQDKIYDDLYKLGVEPRKSLTCKFPNKEQVPEEFTNSFILGYFDGDGSISIKNGGVGWNIVFIGTFDFCEKIKLFLLDNNNIASNISLRQECRLKGDGRIFYLAINGTCNKQDGFNRLERIYNYLYSGNTFSLQRKHIKFQQLLDYGRRKFIKVS